MSHRRRGRPRGRAPVFAAILLSLLSLPALPAQEGPAPSRASLGMELGYFSGPLGLPDPYSFGAQAGLGGELPLGPSSPLRGGIWLAAAGFGSREEGFGDSLMFQASLEAGWSLLLLRAPGASVSLRPLARLGWYLRRIPFLGEEFWTSRPIAGAGCLLELRYGRTGVGLSLLASVPAENHPVLTLGVSQRLALWF